MALPSAYQEVTYIESSGTQYIDTGVTATQLVGFEMGVFMGTAPSLSNRDFVFCGSASGGSSSAPYDTYRYGVWGCWHPTNSSDRNYQIAYPVSTSRLSQSHSYSEGESISISYNVSSAVCIINGSSYQLTLYSMSANNVSLFATTTSYGVGRYGSFKLTYAKIYSNGALVRNFVPCYRKSDNVVGLYDTVNSVFYTNSGSGSFTAGTKVYNLGCTLVNGTGYLISHGITLIGGTQYFVNKGISLINGTAHSIQTSNPKQNELYLFKDGIPQYSYLKGSYAGNAVSAQGDTYWELHSYRASIAITNPIDITNFSKWVVICNTKGRSSGTASQIFYIYSSVPSIDAYAWPSGNQILATSYNVTGTLYEFDIDISSISGSVYFALLSDDDNFEGYMNILESYLA